MAMIGLSPFSPDFSYPKRDLMKRVPVSASPSFSTTKFVDYLKESEIHEVSTTTLTSTTHYTLDSFQFRIWDGFLSAYVSDSFNLQFPEDCLYYIDELSVKIELHDYIHPETGEVVKTFCKLDALPFISFIAIKEKTSINSMGRILIGNESIGLEYDKKLYRLYQKHLMKMYDNHQIAYSFIANYKKFFSNGYDYIFVFHTVNGNVFYIPGCIIANFSSQVKGRLARKVHVQKDLNIIAKDKVFKGAVEIGYYNRIFKDY